MNFDSTPLPPGEAAPDSSEFPVEPLHFSRPRIPEDITVPWGYGDLAVFVLVAVAGAFAGTLLLVLLFGAFGVPFGTIQKSAHWQSLLSVILQFILDLGLIAYLALRVKIGFQLPFWKTIGWRKFETGKIPVAAACAGLMLFGGVVSFIITAAADLHPPKNTPPVEAIFQDRLSGLLFLLMAVLLAPIVEETIFRGFLYPVLAYNWSVGAGIVVTGALFGLLHAPQLGGAWWQIGLLMVVGIIFTWVRASMKTVVASYFLHLGYNSFLLAAFLASTHWLRMIPAGN